MNFEQRNHWNRQHKILSGIITKPETHTEAVAIILELHTALYASEESNGQQITYEDSLGDKLLESTARSGVASVPLTFVPNTLYSVFCIHSVNGATTLPNMFGFPHTFGPYACM